MSTQDVRAEALLNIRCIVKGAHLCRFEVNVSEVFTATKKREERVNAFKVVNHRGQLGHLQSELVDPLWPLHADISVLVNFFYLNCNKQSGQANMKLFKTHTLLFRCTVHNIIVFAPFARTVTFNLSKIKPDSRGRAITVKEKEERLFSC